jgi:hypothetical protein
VNIWTWIGLFLFIWLVKMLVKGLVANDAKRTVMRDERLRAAAQREDDANRPAPGRTGPQFPSAEDQTCEVCQRPGHRCSGDADCLCCQRTARAQEDNAMREKVATALTGLGYTKAQTKEAVILAWQKTEDDEHENEQAMLKATLKQLR